MHHRNSLGVIAVMLLAAMTAASADLTETLKPAAGAPSLAAGIAAPPPLDAERLLAAQSRLAFG